MDLSIGKKIIGDNNPCYVIAEAGSNHNGSLEKAKELIDIAVDAKADAVKFQLFKADEIISKKFERYVSIGGKELHIHNMFKDMEFNRGWLWELNNYCKQKGIDILASPFDYEAVKLLEEIDSIAYKIASFELWHLPLIKMAASVGKPIILSTGMAFLGDIEDAIETVKGAGNNNIALLHCVSNYPSNYNDVNLRAISTMKTAFNLPVGFSDHSLGIEIPMLAVALGANIIEKHFTISRSLEGPDHPFSLEPKELSLMVDAIRNTEQSLGDGQKIIQESEREVYGRARRSIFALLDIPRGTVITEDMLTIIRPGTGLKPKYLDVVIGRKAKQDIKSLEPITWEKI